MKKFARILAIMMVLAMTLALAAPAMAADIGSGTGTITISNAIPGQEYTIYRIADLESVSGTNISYTVNKYWMEFFTKSEVGVTVNATADPNVFYLGSHAIQQDQYAAIAALAVQHAQADANLANTPAKTIAAPESATEKTVEVKFENLPLGYYVIDTSTGTLCALTHTNSNLTLLEKNGTPGIEKYVQEDSTPNEWQYSNDTEFNTAVPFRIIVTKQAGAVNYVVGDKLSEGFTWDAATSGMKVIFNAYNGGNAAYEGISGTDYIVHTNPGADKADEWIATLTSLVGTENAQLLKDYTFVIELKNHAVQNVANGKTIDITYSAVLNDKAKVGVEGNPNEATLSYGNDPRSLLEPVQTKTYVWEFDVLKYTTNSANAKIPLAGATFCLYTQDPYDAQGNLLSTAVDKELWFEKMGFVAGVDTYRYVPGYVHNKDNPDNTMTNQITTTADGKFVIEGLDCGRYYLREISAPKGFNMLTRAILVEIAIANGTSYANDDAVLKCTVNGVEFGGVEVLNSTGVVLPETGGIGTVIFISTGAFLVVTMGVLLVVKKRMGSVIFTR